MIKDPTLLNENPQGGSADINRNFRINTQEDAEYFTWVITKYLQSQANDDQEGLNFRLYDVEGVLHEFLFKISNNEHYKCQLTGMPLLTNELVFAEVMGTGRIEVYCVAEQDEVQFFAQQLMNNNKAINAAIKDEIFDEVLVPIHYRDCFQENLSGLNKRLVIECRHFRKLKIGRLFNHQ
ncbi:hypothetical protein [Rufibacter immobilis]|uniref:hypothetical protein n=1 Tax=Rufibacter immobilis TaxID=1348778 RepID=UPI0035F0295F